jgi:excisionase family DNA binding protein
MGIMDTNDGLVTIDSILEQLRESLEDHKRREQELIAELEAVSTEMERIDSLLVTSVDDRLLTTREASARLSISEKTLRNWMALRRCPIDHYKLGSTRCAPIRFKTSDLDAWLEAQRSPAQLGGSKVSASALKRTRAHRSSQSEIARACAFLAKVLEGGEQSVNDVNAEAAAQDPPIKLRTIERARKDLGVISRRDVFGEKGKWFISLRPPTGNPHADKLLAALAETPNGRLKRVDIKRDLFANNLPAPKVDLAIEALVLRGMVEVVKGASLGGRPPTWVRLTGT